MMGSYFCFDWEVKFMEWLQQAASPIVIKLCAFLSMFGESYLMIAMVGVFYWGINKEMGKRIAVNFAVSNLFTPYLKNVLNRRRPYMDNENIKCLRSAVEGDVYDLNLQGFSCPSLHASNTGAVLATIGQCVKKRSVTIVTSVLILMIGLARVMLGVHYPTDVLLGWLIAAIVVFLAPRLVAKVNNYLIVMLIFAVIGLPGWFFCTSDDFFVGYGAIFGIFTAFYVEEKYVHFENPKSAFRIVLRTIVGIVVTLTVLEGLKLFFPASLMDQAGFVAYLIRTFRYAVAIFVGLGVYPMLFRYTDRFFRKKEG